MTSKVSLYQCISILPKKHLSKILFLLDIEGFPTTYHCLESKFLSSLSSFSFFFKRWKLLLEKFVFCSLDFSLHQYTVSYLHYQNGPWGTHLAEGRRKHVVGGWDKGKESKKINIILELDCGASFFYTINIVWSANITFTAAWHGIGCFYGSWLK